MFRRIAYLLMAALTIAGPVRAQGAPEVVDVQILPGWRTAGGEHMAALEVTLEDGWKTYWRAPGDAGIPPRFDWRPSRNLAGVEILWPTPSISEDYGLRTIGYSNRLILPLKLSPRTSGRDIKLSGTLEIGVCREVCIPVELQISAKLPQSLSKPDPRIAAALANQPFSASEAGVRNVRCRMSPIADGIGLRAEIDMPGAGGRETAIVEVDDPQIWVAQPKTRREGGRLVAETKLYHVEGRSFALNRSGIRITVLGRSHAVDIQGCPAG